MSSIPTNHTLLYYPSIFLRFTQFIQMCKCFKNVFFFPSFVFFFQHSPFNLDIHYVSFFYGLIRISCLPKFCTISAFNRPHDEYQNLLQGQSRPHMRGHWITSDENWYDTFSRLYWKLNLYKEMTKRELSSATSYVCSYPEVIIVKIEIKILSFHVMETV